MQRKTHSYAKQQRKNIHCLRNDNGLVLQTFSNIEQLSLLWATIVFQIPQKRFQLLSSKIYFDHPKKSENTSKEPTNCLIFTLRKAMTHSTNQSIEPQAKRSVVA